MEQRESKCRARSRHSMNAKHNARNSNSMNANTVQKKRSIGKPQEKR